ncbi:MAG: signal transduction histidine kinase [Sulfurimonas sp.]|jgi:signal transduction histidine kinase
MKFFKTFFLNINKYKIYHIIILFTLAFTIMMANGFYVVREELITMAEKNRELIIKDIEYTIYSWIEERIQNLETTMKYFEIEKIYYDEKKIEKFSTLFLNNNKYFDAVQILVTNKYLILNGKMVHDYRKNPIFIGPVAKSEIIKQEWYLNTKNEMKTTLTSLKLHGPLNSSTINICTPITEKKQFIGVMCGVIRSEFIFNKIKKLHLPQKAYYFISDQKGNFLSMSNKNIPLKKLESILKREKEQIYTTKAREEFDFNKDLLTIRPIKHFDWFIGIGMNKDDIMSAGIKKITINTGFLFVCFIILMITINLFHVFWRHKVEKQKDEYEFILTHRSRMSEIGNLISGINHQLSQPINSLQLLSSSVLSQLKNKTLTPEYLKENLEMSQQSISLMSTTFSVFRNFYRCNENISEFSLKECITNILQVLYIDFSKHSIIIQIDNKTEDNFNVVSIENFIQQILLVLLQNAKEALSEKSKINKKKIKISVFTKGENIIMDVADWGEGISKDIETKLFTNIKSSKKDLGSGIGLHFAKMLAQKKLGGDLTLFKSNSPTVFRFSFLAQLNTKE